MRKNTQSPARLASAGVNAASRRAEQNWTIGARRLANCHAAEARRIRRSGAAICQERSLFRSLCVVVLAAHVKTYSVWRAGSGPLGRPNAVTNWALRAPGGCGASYARRLKALWTASTTSERGTKIQ